MPTKRDPYLTVNNVDPYKVLAAAILRSAIDENDVDFVYSTWCECLCNFLGVSHSAVAREVKDDG